MNNLGEKIIKKIKEKGITPKPKWTFLLKDYLVWLISIICLIIGAFAFSVVIYMFRNNNWDVWQYINDSFLSFVLVTLPYFWLLFLILFIWLVYYNFKHTKKGYKYKVLTVIITSIVISLFLGVLLYNFGVGQAIDEVLGKEIPFYQRMFNKAHQHMRLWSQPNKGLLAGTIVALEEDKIFVLQDFKQEIWQVDARRAAILPQTIIEPGSRIRMIGKELPDYHFEAHQIMPMMPKIRKPEEFPPIIRKLRLMPDIRERTIPDLRSIE